MATPHRGWLILLAASSFVVFPIILPGDVTLSHAQAKATVFLLGGLLLLGWMLLPTWWLRAGLVLGVLSAVASGLRIWALAPLVAYLIWGTGVGWAGGLDDEAWRRVRWVITIAAAIQAAWMGWQWITAYAGDPLYWPSLRLFALKTVPGDGRLLITAPIGFFGNPSDAGLFLGLALPFAMTWWAAGLIAGGAILSSSGAATLLVAVAASWWLLRRRWRWWLVPVGAGGLAALGVLYGWLDPAWAGGSLQGRLAVWDQALVLIARAPWLGWGWGSLGTRVNIVWQTERWTYLHNEWLQVAMEGGIVALLLALIVLIWLACRLWERGITDERIPGLFAVIVAATVSIPFRLAPTALLVAVWIGGLLREEHAA